MSNPTTPQAELRRLRMVQALARVVVVLVVVLIAFLLWVGTLHVLLLIPLASIALLAVLALVMVELASRDAERHSLPGGEHRCQCVDCERPGTAVGPPVRRRGRNTGPSYLRRTAVSAFVTAVLLVPGLLPTMYLLLPAMPVEMGLFLLALPVLLGLALAGFGVVCLVQAARGARIPADHGCACRWCGAPSRPDAGVEVAAGAWAR